MLENKDPAVSRRYSFSLLIMSQFVNVEEGTSGQLPTAHRNGTNTEVSGHIQRGTPDNSGVEVQGVEVRGVEVQGISSSSDRESTRLLHWKKSISKVRPLVNISPFILCVYKISIEPFFLYNTVINYDRKCFEIDEIVSTVDMVLNPFNNFLTIGSYAFLLDAFVVRRVGSLKKVLQGIILFLLLQIGLLDFCFRPNGGHSL
ncbi:hypothetical protein Dsin_012628 [Dipteronia sinensis]|uniref:Uncharacterized protein n=1 Tax=Dipteronia sinensis TaxID=43782 RepID=A0AAE0AIX1_9ROSI|nr:hypothetical protein Dsin_012628 [Dipteronia sinensis]